jgi:hypothetical protein
MPDRSIFTGQRSVDAPSVAAGADDFGRACLVVAAGCAAALLVTMAACRLPAVRDLTWAGLLVRCLADVALSVVAGSAGLYAAWLLTPTRPQVPLRQLFFHGLLAWLLLPAIVLLDRTWPAWALPVIAATAAGIAVSLRLLAPDDSTEDDFPLPAVDFASFYGARLTGFRAGRALAIALCAEGSLVLAVREDYVLAGLLLGLGMFLLLWHWGKDVRVQLQRRERGVATQGAAGVAWLLCILALLPWLAHHRGAVPVAAKTTAPLPLTPHYWSVVLWPPKERVTRLYFPVANAAPVAPNMARPTEIPFNGAYWYFEAPDTGPGMHPHVAHGLPTDAQVDLHSAGGGPLRMDAVQRLDKPIPFGCCSEMDVSVTDADSRAGLVRLGVLLTDGATEDAPSVLLGFEPIAGSETMSLGTRQSAVDDTVRFSFPRSHSLKSFNQITVIVIPAVDPARGARVVIHGFTLLPR